ncbi:hypothetical protein [Geomonas ferrireducens]|uniref:hypothetical protein n=1 Tax=Geomonas ferrireducens TaxID=2570227 RepID=UPI0010A83B15|nr:hypothetical protein [Geomonas ferrireducens]
MKHFWVIFVLATLMTAQPTSIVSAQKSPPTSAEHLLRRFEAALKAKDSQAIIELYNWQGVSAKMRAIGEKSIRAFCSEEAKSVELRPLPAGFQVGFEQDGIRYRPNVTIVGVIYVQYVKAGNSLQIPYGKKKNAFYLPGITEKRFSPVPAVKEKMLIVGVGGTTSPAPAFEGSYIYLKGGKEIKEAIRDEFHIGNLSKSFWGDRIKSCTVRKTSPGGEIQLIIREDGKEIFKSEWETTTKPIVYKAKGLTRP